MDPDFMKCHIFCLSRDVYVFLVKKLHHGKYSYIFRKRNCLLNVSIYRQVAIPCNSNKQNKILTERYSDGGPARTYRFLYQIITD